MTRIFHIIAIVIVFYLLRIISRSFFFTFYALICKACKKNLDKKSFTFDLVTNVADIIAIISTIAVQYRYPDVIHIKILVSTALISAITATISTYFTKEIIFSLKDFVVYDDKNFVEDNNEDDK